MSQRYKTWTAIAVATLAAVTMGVAHAVPSYGNIANSSGGDGGPDNSDGVYFGNGNVDGNWTIDTSNNVEVALRAKNRATLATIDGSSGVYYSLGGLCNPTCTGGTKALWNYEFSVNTQAGGPGLTLADVLVRLTIDTDPGVGTSFIVLDVLNNWPDNSYWNGTTKSVGLTPPVGYYGAQQSANPLFGDSGFMPGFNPQAHGVYDIQLSVYDKATSPQLLAQTAIHVSVPEPASILLLGIGLVGLAATRRRKAAARLVA